MVQSDENMNDDEGCEIVTSDEVNSSKDDWSQYMVLCQLKLKERKSETLKLQ